MHLRRRFDSFLVIEVRIHAGGAADYALPYEQPTYKNKKRKEN
jgi:hypothetical protein